MVGLEHRDTDSRLAIAKSIVGFHLCGVTNSLIRLYALYEDILGDMDVLIPRYLGDRRLYAIDRLRRRVADFEDDACCLTAHQAAVLIGVDELQILNLQR